MDDAPADNDSSLITALRAGEATAYERLVRENGNRLLTVAKRLLVNHEDALDAVQETFLSAFKSLDTFDGRSRLSTWLHRIVVNASLMKLRTKRRHPEESIDNLLPSFRSDGHRVVEGGCWRLKTSRLEQQETLALIRSKIDSLPDSYRVVLVLRDIEELDTETIAQFLEITPGAVKVRLHRARQALRTLLNPLFGDPA